MIGRWTTSRVKDEEQTTGFDSFDLRLGDVMRGERATLAKSLLDVQRELKIKATYIAAIENTDASAFETQGFIAGYVRSYARYLGLDPEWAYDKFCAEAGFATAHGMSAAASTKVAAPLAKPTTKNNDPFSDPNASWVPQSETLLARVEPGAAGSLVALIGLVAVLGFAGWSVLQEIQRVDFAPIDQTPGVLSELPQLDAGTEVADASGLGAGLVTPPSVDALDRLYRPAALDVPVMTHRDAPISTLDPNSVGLLAGVTAPTLAPAPAFGATDQTGSNAFNVIAAVSDARPVQVFGEDAAEVAVFAVRPSWIRIQSVDGSVIFEKVLDAGEHYVLPKTEQAPVLRSGNAGAIYFAVNGTAYGPAGQGPSIVKNVALSQAALTESYSLANVEEDQALATYVAELSVGN